ncbi:DUF4367 domain-containing protein [Cohnella luojiensis]|uniref:DUF4367 domain-containing protein n=1 Tax=Cohnella luojiensis TaxID=652876 RepID=A0A4Y8M291_9BACL|nr:DUF4367 domain-containing protein [Cohnella luojiensis]TFE29382.1 DUF4367 domain-containing protein [Cohnella luojiensis]
MNNAQFDQLFDAAFEASSEQLQTQSTVDHRASWQRVQQKLLTLRRRKSMRSKLTKLTAIAASLLLGAAIFGNNPAARAIDPIYATLKEYPSGVLGFFFGRNEDKDASGAKTAPPPAFGEGLDIEKMNESTYVAHVNEAQASNLLSFPAPVFRYIPTHYTFYEAQIYFQYTQEQKADDVAYLFVNENEKYMHVSLKKLASNTGIGTSKVSEGVTVKKIQLSDVTAILTTATNGSNSLETIRGDIHINMSGIVPSDELIRMYEEMYE